MSETLTAREELDEVAADYREHDAAEKKAKAQKEKLRPAFLDLMTEVVEAEIPLDRLWVEVDPDSLDLSLNPNEAIDKWRRENYPEHDLIDLTGDEETGQIMVVLQESPTSRKFTFINDGYVYGRTIAMIGATFDAEGLYKHVEETLEGDRDYPTIEALNAIKGALNREVKVVYSLNEEIAREVMAEHPETVALFQQFADPGTPQVRLLPIRKAKDEDYQ